MKSSSLNSRYIPRKPHPNGMMSHGISGYTANMRVPMLLDLEPYVPLNKSTPRDAAQLLLERTLAAHPNIQYHIVMDSGFGSFDEMDYYCSKNVLTTMSLSSNQWEWLFDLLGWSCPLEAGRTALVPLPGSKEKVLASIYHVKSESGKMIDIRTLSSAFKWKVPLEEEYVVVGLGQRRVGSNEKFEYETFWSSGEKTWEPSSVFMDDDGTFNVFWLQMAKLEDILDALGHLTQAEMQTICDGQGLKVPSHHYLHFHMT